jgi:hypothetical protein
MGNQTQSSAPKTKFFRIASEGATCDGRTIDRELIQQMAKNYDPQKYGARVNLEHIKGILPDSPFKAYGDVIALKTAEGQDGKLMLLAQIDPTPELVAMTKARQKIYTSCEIQPKFADTGEAYLMGLAVTDSPASLGTEMLKFSAQAGANSPLNGRKIHPDNLFSAAAETLIEFETEDGPGLLDKVKALFNKRDQGNEAKFADVHDAVKAIATRVAEQETAFARSDAVADLRTEHEDLKAQFSALKTQLAKEPGSPPRQKASGHSGDTETDC